MFTGLVEQVGVIREVRRDRGGETLRIEAHFDGVPERGESICVSGACLTVESATAEAFTVFASAETLDKTTLANAGVGRRVNLERALRIGDRLGGHFVSGHVDGQGRVRRLVRRGEAHEIAVEVPSELLRYLPSKGSVTIDGVSLTVNKTEGGAILVTVIPHTWDATTFTALTAGTTVNLEIDILARYVASELFAKL